MARSPVRAQQLVAVAPVFTALSDPTRLYLVGRLCAQGPLSITRLTAGTELSRQAVTKHLRVLSRSGLARSRRRGREQLWQIEAARLAEVSRLLARISTQWDEALGRLAAFVEREDH